MATPQLVDNDPDAAAFYCKVQNSPQEYISDNQTEIVTLAAALLTLGTAKSAVSDFSAKKRQWPTRKPASLVAAWADNSTRSIRSDSMAIPRNGVQKPGTPSPARMGAAGTLGKASLQCAKAVDK